MNFDQRPDSWTKNYEKMEVEQKLDDFENIEVKLVDFEEAVEMVIQNKIPDMGSALAILLLKEKVEKGEIRI